MLHNIFKSRIQFLKFSSIPNFFLSTSPSYNSMEQPELYESKKVAAISDAAEFIPKFISQMDWKSNQNILDFGCGPGSVYQKYFYPLTKKYGSKVVGVDISLSMIKFAKENIIGLEKENVEFYAGDILCQDWKKLKPFQNQYDHIFSIYVLHHIPDYTSAIERLYELLKPNGYFAATVMSSKVLYKINQKLKSDPILGNYMKDLYIPDWIMDPSLDATMRFQNACKTAGFKFYDVQQHDREATFNNGFEGLADALMSVNPCTHLIPEELRPTMKKFYIDNFKCLKCSKLNEENNSVVQKYDMVTIFARK